MIREKFKAALADARKFKTQLTDLQDNVHGLQNALGGARNFADAVSGDIVKWRFKCQPRIERIQKIVNRLSKSTK
ncbi:hypothetical protein [Limosilactobacillus sp.]|jgi:CHASE1-domain containing sensor protein|uniref:hypothetical protein n=1 Tax=Limosilactobacillus sp. TaxID=2773925 RepID=UPI0025B831EE|nr:hypothetical protein [Limosilactobacillus sp.]MCH3923120.1 hypothetical protein [Limosilactobacillus sp.]MCH3927803.1 hypothetical protein [Limosilactobacillus sp.]